MTSRDLAGRVDALAEFVRLVAPYRPEAAEQLARAGELCQRAARRLGLSGEHTVVALAGATGAGKSSLFNALAGMPLSRVGHLRPTTATAQACVWGHAGAEQLLEWLGVAHRLERESVLDGQAEASLRGLVLLDLPDIDSIAGEHRLEVDRLIEVVDQVVWVLDPQKYADQAVHEQYLRRLGGLREVMVVVLNQVDVLGPADAEQCEADLARLVAADGLAGVPVIATSARTGVGVAELRALLERVVARRQAASARLHGELDEVVAQLAPLVSGPGKPPQPAGTRLVGHPNEDRAGDPAADPAADLAAELVSAGGVAAIAEAAGQAYRRASTLRGWRSRTERVPTPPVDLAAVRAALRRFSARASAGTAPGWADQARAVTPDPQTVADWLAAQLAATAPRPRRQPGWVAVPALGWFAVVAVVGGAGWLGASAVRHTALPLAALLLLGAGTLVALLIVGVAQPLRRLAVRRATDRTRRRLAQASAEVARETAVRVRQLLDDYAAAREALHQAQRRQPQEHRATSVAA